MKTLKSIFTIIVLCILVSCNTNEKRVIPEAVRVDGLEMKLISIKGQQMNLIVRNLSGKQFAYAEFTQTQEMYKPLYEQLRFSSVDTLSISVISGDNVIFYELVPDGNQKKLQEKVRFIYFGKLFNLY